MDYKGKKVLVTGGASGIGREIALEYARAGALVIVADKDYEGDRFVRGELRPIMPECCFFHCDLALSSACENLMQSIFEQFDDLDIIINNAGVSQFCSLWEETVEHWDYVLNSNLRAMFLISREYMINRRKKGYKERYGRIVNISSTRSLMSEPFSFVSSVPFTVNAGLLKSPRYHPGLPHWGQWSQFPRRIPPRSGIL